MGMPGLCGVSTWENEMAPLERAEKQRAHSSTGILHEASINSPMVHMMQIHKAMGLALLPLLQLIFLETSCRDF